MLMRYHVGLGVGHTYGFHPIPHQATDTGLGGEEPEEPEELNTEDPDLEAGDGQMPEEQSIDLDQEAGDDNLGSPESASQSSSSYSSEVAMSRNLKVKIVLPMTQTNYSAMDENVWVRLIVSII